MGSFIVDFISDFVFDMLVLGTGHAILRVVFPNVPPTENKALFAGLSFWLTLALLTALLVWGILIA